ncbi:hypothetical protein B484DRAFT_450636 [Ochromonadaceae sp. CCMP2298]|nr:hypothetical protein B484DRAFT_450636 [Ochromonadaceae sp. CCMP2298]
MDDKYATCGACTQRKKTKKTLPCICRSAVFCSEECRIAGHAGCSGKRLENPTAYRTIEEFRASDGDKVLLDKIRVKDAALRDLLGNAVSEDPRMFPLLLQSDQWELNFKNVVDVLRKHIDNGEGRGGDMYLLACCCGMRIDVPYNLSKPPAIPVDYRSPQPSPPPMPPASLTAMSDHESNELACKYYRMAAADGFQLAKFTLAKRLLDKGGTARYSTEAEDLLLEVIHMPQAYEMLAKKSGFALEIEGIAKTILQFLNQIPPGQDFELEGPNAASAVLATVAPALFGSQFSPHGEALVCRASGVQLMVAVKRAAARGVKAVYCYGRAGTGNEATRLSMGKHADGPRRRTMPMFKVGAPTVPDVSEVDIAAWELRLHLSSSPVRVSCAHAYVGEQACPQCLGEARARLSAVANGNYALSQHEERVAHGLTALFLTSDAKVATAGTKAEGDKTEAEKGEGGAQTSDVLTSQRRETFRAYSCADVNTYLHCLSLESQEGGPLYSHPLFLAMDANLFWPVIFHYGSLRAGLQAAAPRSLPVTEGSSGSSSGGSGSGDGGSGAYGVFGGLVKKCGHEECMRLAIRTDESDSPGKDSADSPKDSSDISNSTSSSKGKGFFRFKCSLCVARVYCCPEHQRADWKIHKLECRKV